MNNINNDKYYTNSSIEKDIAENNVTNIKRSLGSICYTIDFINGNFEKAVRYVEEGRGIKLKEALNDDFPFVYSEEKGDYTGEDLGLAVFYLQENFCDERIKDIKKIRAIIDRKNEERERKEEEEKRRMQRPSSTSSNANSKKMTSRQSSNVKKQQGMSAIIGILLVILVVLIGILFLKK